jgi:hypothetical protein
LEIGSKPGEKKMAKGKKRDAGKGFVDPDMGKPWLIRLIMRILRRHDPRKY